MKKTYIMRLLSAVMCIVMVLALLGGCAAPAESPDDGHDHDTEDLDDVVLDDPDVPMAGRDQATCPHTSTTTSSKVVENDCQYGKAWWAIETCNDCGASWNTACRPVNEEDGWTAKEHSFQKHTVTGGCTGNPMTYEECSSCGYKTMPTGGRHSWSDWSAPENVNPCSDTYTETRTCSSCSAEDTRQHNPIGHSWRIDSEKQPTCEEPGEITKTCNRCHTTVTETGKPALGHQYKQTETDCTSAKECQRCHKTISGGQHTYVGYKSDASGHWQVCEACRIRTNTESHTDNGAGFCSVCGYQMRADAKPGVCAHDWQYRERDPKNASRTGRNGAFSHWEYCTKCGETRSANCSNYPGTRTYCTDPIYCTVCGNKIEDGNSKHYMSDWIMTAEGHERHCESVLGCAYTESAAHTFNGKSNDCTKPDKCTVCGYTTGSAASKTHNWGAWFDGGSGTHIRKCQNAGCTVTESAMHVLSGSTDDCTNDMRCSVCNAIVVEGSDTHVWGHPVSAGEGGHNRHCLHPGCSAVQNAAHSGGTATCTSPAQCVECGGFYGAKNPNNHTGGTEIRDAVPATVGKAGYTGDTYCVGCGQKIASGQTIEALKEDHSHAYGAQWVSDDTGHWHVCTCGEKGSFAVHDYKDGKCSVCDAADPNYVEHVHTYTETWSADSHNHWHVCTGCGEKADVTEHVIVTTDDGSTHCLTCGMTLEDYKAKVEEETGKAPGTQPEDQPGETEPGTEPGGTQSPEQPPVEEHPSVKFNDLSTAPQYQTEAVDFVYNKGLMSGTSTSTFAPNQSTTRGQVMTILAKMNGVDTSGNDWQQKGYNWAVSKGLTDNDDFNAVMSRPELIYMLWKATGSQTANLSALDKYADAGTLEGDYRLAMAWAVEALGLKGDNTSLLLDQPISRIQLAIILNSADSKGLLG